MEEFAHLFHGFAIVLQPYNIMLMCIGILLGVIIGVLPGLGGAGECQDSCRPAFVTRVALSTSGFWHVRQA